MGDHMLEIKDLRVSFHTYAGEVQALGGINFTVGQSEILAVVGESGCGKSVTAQSILRLHNKDTIDYKQGEILYKGRDLLALSEKEMQKIRGREISMIFQDPMTSLNPTLTIGKQITEAILKHSDKEGNSTNQREANKQAAGLIRSVGIANPDLRLKQYPHELSGGMRQRIMIAIAMSCSPEILIADEPTTALDVTVQAQILDLMKALQIKSGASIVIITHNMGVVANIAQKVIIMYGGVVVEKGTSGDIFYRPKHPYTWGLLKSIFRLNKDKNEPLIPIDGIPPDLLAPPKGCPFAPRCDYAMKVCREQMPREYSFGSAHTCDCWLSDENCPLEVKDWRNGDVKYKQ
ncbi:MAG: ABC transporter ATP-binding protein [Peptococcaceae bacterium]|jgi:oligopeptide transport system ATP-binding protein|nr:ABC transporter ATP-binding protein [Peptococcaceae bacterium]